MDEKIISQDALIDNRPPVVRDKDYSTKEVASAAAVTTFKNTKITTPTATEFNQWYVGSCVPHGFLTQLEYEGIAAPDISRLRAYRKRSNYPHAGSAGVDMYDQIRSGQSNDFYTPVRFREADANKMPYVFGLKLLKDFNYYQYIDKRTWITLINDVPADVALGKAVAIFIYASDYEWSKLYVEAIDAMTLENAEVRHCVCIVPYGDFTENGKRWLTVQDSAKFGGLGLRHVEFDTFMKQRCYFAAKVYALGDLPVPGPVRTGIPDSYCELGNKNDSVIALQSFLVKDKKLAAQYITGYYGALTAKAVLWWQLEHWEKYSANIPTLLEWGGKYWGEQSIKIIQK